MDLVLREDIVPSRSDLLALYEAVGWTAYTRDAAALERAVAGSSYRIAAYRADRLLGLARAISDGVSIAYLQDVLVHPDVHRQGIGRRLVEAYLARHAHVRQKVLLTDGRTEQLEFYRALGYREASELGLHTFIRLEH
ncbi:MAG: GNAT family N-acetyltransferase [Proteobacteria bacterium]|nr:GNAT family N-acetyltransferase [Pseudomonadota bacterium]